MKRSCVRCERTSSGNNLFCHDLDCPAEQSPAILDAGDRVADLEIVKVVTTVRSATVYEALAEDGPVFMKVAHPGASHRDRLIREAWFLRSLRMENKKKNRYPALPRLRPPYPTTTLDQDAYGTTMLGRELLHYFLFDPVDGESLQDLLRQRPQWWIHHVGWLSIELATTMNTLHVKGLYHFGLTPASVIVRFDAKPFVPHILLCDLGVACDTASLVYHWYPEVAPPAYLAPELLADGSNPVRGSVQSDVYGLGLVLYEMLVGRPVFANALAPDGKVVEAIRRDERVPMSRVEDVSPVAELALRAGSPNVDERPQTAADVVDELRRMFGPVPVKKESPLPSMNFILILGGVALMVAFLVSLAIVLSSQTQ